MNKRLILLIMILLLVPMIMAACGEDEGDDDDNGDNGDDNGSVELSQSFSEEISGATLTFDYPEGWVASNEGFAVIVGNSQETVTSALEIFGSEETIPEGQGGLILLLGPTGDQTLDALEEEAASEEIEGELERVTIAGQEAIQFTQEQNDNRLVNYFIIFGDNAVTANAAARTSEYDDFEATFEAILETISVEAAATDDGGETGDAADDGGETGDEAEDGGETGDEAEDGGETGDEAEDGGDTTG